MLRFELHELLFVYVGLSLGVVLLAALAHNVRRTRRDELALHNVLKCRLCAFEFRDQTHTELPPCPRCGALAARKRVSSL